MSFTALMLILMLIFWWLQKDPDCKCWIGFFIMVIAAGMLGYQTRSFGLLIAVGIFKIIKDIFCHR
jgi:prepilin signal peptidase PulO-like enzyme (type II secretory pathway)